MHASGLSEREIADALGISHTAAHYAVNPEAYERALQTHLAWSQSGVCQECGGPMNRNSRNGGDRTLRSTRCRRCAAAARVTTARPDTLRCATCREWKPDHEFGNDLGAPGRRDRRSRCRDCENRQRQKRRRNVGSRGGGGELGA